MTDKKYSLFDFFSNSDVFEQFNLSDAKKSAINKLITKSLEFCSKLNLPTTIAQRYLVDFSVTNPTSIKFYKSLENLLLDTSDNEGKATVMKFGKFLTYTEQFTETSIKSYVEIFNSFLNNYKYYTVPVNHPDGWVDIYENGSGFTSCMLYDRKDWYLHKDHYGEFHPVKAYCHPDNTIELAYLANKEWKPGIKDFIVAARAIINTESKKFYEVYGDTALKMLLKQKGFTYSDDYLLGQSLVKKQRNGYYIGPCLDGKYHKLNEHEDRWIISENGDYAAYNLDGIIHKLRRCPTCGATVYNGEDLIGPDSECCDKCIDDYFVHVYVDKYIMEYIPFNSLYYEYHSEYYTKEALRYCDLILIDGEVYPLSGVVETTRGLAPEDDVIELDIPFNGIGYAYKDDIIYVWDVDGNKLTAHENITLGDNTLFATKEEYLAFIKAQGHSNG
jgi:ribosomal protein S27AE